MQTLLRILKLSCWYLGMILLLKVLMCLYFIHYKDSKQNLKNFKTIYFQFSWIFPCINTAENRIIYVYFKLKL